MRPDFTGERCSTTLRGEISYEHLHRYAVAVPACVGRRVLDVACGEGYGAAMLSRVAASVIGVDIDAASIEWARHNYYHINLQFAQGSATELPVVDDSIDVITCFETIEHLEDHEGMLDEFRRVLAPGGLLMVSTPNKLVYTDKRGSKNPFHVRELYFEEFRDLLQRHFPHVRLYGQRTLGASVLYPLGGAPDGQAGWHAGNEEQLTPGLPALPDPVYFLAVCSYASLPDEISSGFINPQDGLQIVSDDRYAHLLPPATRTGPRILLACAPKSGSTFVTSVLARYFNARIGSKDLREIQWEAEQNLTRAYLDQMGDEAFVLQLHMKPFPLFLALLRQYETSLLLQWRNIGDVIVSLDEHLVEFGAQQPLCYIHDAKGFLALPRDRRYAFLIKNVTPWYLWFYLAWRREGATFGVYERMVADPTAYFSEIIQRLSGSLDPKRLAEVLEAPGEFTRLNVGRAGRSNELFSDDNKRALEQILLENPWSEQLEILLWELPWKVPALGKAGSLDGSVVKTAASDALYFVSRGRRRRLQAPDSWLASRATLGSDTVKTISPKRMENLPEESPLT